MVSIIPAKRSPFHGIAEAMSQFGQNAPALLEERYQTQRGLSAVDQLQESLKEAKGDISKILPAIAKAYSVNPNLQRSGIAEHALKMAQAENAQNVQRPGEEQGQFQTAPKQNLPGFMQQPGQEVQPPENKFFPTNQPGSEAPGNIPQASTTGQAVNLLTPTQKIAETKKLMSSAREQNIPLTYAEARDEVNAAEEEKKAHNLQVEAERKQRVGAQREYGTKAVEQLNKVFPAATPEMEAIFKRKGEEAAAEGKSEADIDRHLAVEAKNFKNMYSNIEKDLSAPRLQNQMQRSFLQSAKDFDQSSADLRVKLKPLLDLGLYDTARNLLTNLGYYPEERETIINPMSERQKTVLNRVPKAEKIYKEELGTGLMGNVPSFQRPYSYNPHEIDNIKSGLNDLKEADPNFSLVLARKAFEDKNYDWRIFKDALNSLEQDGYELTTDQEVQRSVLDSPPLNTLEKVLHGLNLQGR
jgi:hypothetical protein